MTRLNITIACLAVIAALICSAYGGPPVRPKTTVLELPKATDPELKNYYKKLNEQQLSNAPGALAIPANDNCNDATTIQCCTFGVAGDNSGATWQNIIPYDMHPDVWYKFVGTGEWVSLSTCQDSWQFDTMIDLWDFGDDENTCTSSGIRLCQNDDSIHCHSGYPLIYQSHLTFWSELDKIYRIRIHGYGGAKGIFNLRVSCNVPEPTEGHIGQTFCQDYANDHGYMRLEQESGCNGHFSLYGLTEINQE